MSSDPDSQLRSSPHAQELKARRIIQKTLSCTYSEAKAFIRRGEIDRRSQQLANANIQAAQKPAALPAEIKRTENKFDPIRLDLGPDNQILLPVQPLDIAPPGTTVTVLITIAGVLNYADNSVSNITPA